MYRLSDIEQELIDKGYWKVSKNRGDPIILVTAKFNRMTDTLFEGKEKMELITEQEIRDYVKTF